MKNKGKNLNSEEIKIQGLLDGFLRANSSKTNFENEEQHLDEDSFTAFVEGNFSEKEAETMVTHLVSCSYCRHIMAELTKLDMAFAENVQTVPTETNETQPMKVSDILSGVLSNVFGTNNGAVFAHSEDEKESEENKDEKESAE